MLYMHVYGIWPAIIAELEAYVTARRLPDRLILAAVLAPYRELYSETYRWLDEVKKRPLPPKMKEGVKGVERDEI